ncbi:hypothetical protein FRC17_008051, partial [Serendipita sp. 399]
MTQTYLVANLDQRSYVIFGPLKNVWLEESWLKYLLEYGWAGDRIILLGDSAEYFPPQVLNKGEYDEWLSHANTPWNWVVATFHEPKSVSPRTLEAEKMALVNLSQQQYVRGDIFSGGAPKYNELMAPLYPTELKHPDLGHALVAQIIWSQDPSMGLPGSQPETMGSWAGSRIIVDDVEQYKNDSKYKDITEIVFRGVYFEWNDVTGMLFHCCCPPCTKFGHMTSYANPYFKEPGYFPIILASDRKSADLKGVKDDAFPLTGFWNVTYARDPVRLLSNSGIFPLDVQRIVFMELDTLSLAACASVCADFYFEATRALYLTVTLKGGTHLGEFCDTLARDPLKKQYIQRLDIQLELSVPARESVYSILKELKNLEHLVFRPCWMSYGETSDRKGFPFKLRSLSWGLIPD